MDPRQVNLGLIVLVLIVLSSLSACRVGVTPVDGVRRNGRTELTVIQPGVALKPLSEAAPVRVLLPQDSTVSTSTLTLLAYYKHGYTPLGACTYKEVLDEVAKQARSVGASTVRIVEILAPDDRGSCFRMQALLYK